MLAPIQPVADGRALPEDVHAALRTDGPEIPLLFGTNADEVRLTAPMLYPGPFDESTIEAHATAVFGSREAGAEALQVYRNSRPDLDPKDLWIAVENDRCVRIPALQMAAAHRGPAYCYFFDYASTAFDGQLGAAHTLEIPFVFDNLDADGVETMLGPIGDPARELAGTMSDAWTSFARTGEPVLMDGGWPAYEPEHRRVLQLGTRQQVLQDPQGAERRLWDGVL